MVLQQKGEEIDQNLGLRMKIDLFESIYLIQECPHRFLTDCVCCNRSTIILVKLNYERVQMSMAGPSMNPSKRLIGFENQRFRLHNQGTVCLINGPFKFWEMLKLSSILQPSSTKVWLILEKFELFA